MIHQLYRSILTANDSNRALGVQGRDGTEVLVGEDKWLLIDKVAFQYLAVSAGASQTIIVEQQVRQVSGTANFELWSPNSLVIPLF